jgi:hypothetical protein
MHAYLMVRPHIGTTRRLAQHSAACRAIRGKAGRPDTCSAPQAEKVNFDIIILEQSPNYRFNRGLLLNAGVLLTHSLDHDYYVFNDVDTVPAKGSGIHYTYPEGARPLHITPPGMHPKYAHAEVRRPFIHL